MSFINRKVTPSYIGIRSMGMTDQPATHAGTFQLMLGEVKEIIESTDERNLSRLYREYHVDVQYREDTGPVTTVRFPNCQIMNAFGGISDRFQYSLRADGRDPEANKVSAKGSKVLMLCLNGSAGNAYIVGGVREDKQQDAEGHSLYFEFNGISFAIDKEGQLKLQFRGPTTGQHGDDGLSVLDTDAGADEKNGPTSIEIQKNGNFRVYTKDENQSILIDHENKKAEFVFDQEWNVKVTGQVSIKSSGVQIGDATDNLVKGTTYRQAETQLHSQLLTNLGNLSAQIALAGAAITAAATALATPVTGGPAASPLLAPAGAALTSAVTAITQMAQALTSFEGQADSYLSTKNKAD